MSYLVLWKIDSNADTPEQAAMEALQIMRDPDSIATVFDIVDTSTKTHTLIDVEDGSPVIIRKGRESK